MQVYIAGPMRGMPGLNFAAFDEARDRLIAAGHEPISPADKDRQLGCPWVGNSADHSEADILSVLTNYFHTDVRDVLLSDAVAVLPGWQKSRLGKVEVYLALEFGKIVLDAITLKPITVDVTITGRERFRWPLIGFTGYATSGKDTAADALKSCGWVKRGFADPLYEMLLKLNPLIPADSAEQADEFGINYMSRLRPLVADIGWTRAKQIGEVRRHLQHLGTEAGRDILGADLWVDYAERRLLKTSAPVCFTNVRFENEVDMIRRNGGRIIRILRYGCIPSLHVSEIQEFESDAAIDNNGTIRDLQQNVLQLVSRWHVSEVV